MTLILSFAALLPRLLLGFFIIHFIWNATDGKSLLVKIFLSAGIGFGISSLFGFLWIWLGLPLDVYAILESILAIVLTGWRFYAHRPRLQKLTGRLDLIWTLILAMGVFLFTMNLAVYALQYPHGRPDAWINWNVVARFLYLGGADWQATFLRQWDHPDYPLFMAVTNAITWVFVRRASTWGPIAFHFMISIFTAGLLFALVNWIRGFKQASLAVVFFISLPFVVNQGMRQYADFLLAHLILAVGGLTMLYFQTKETRLAILAGLLIGLGGWAKNEGLAAIVGFTAAWILIAWKTERPVFQNYILGLAFPLLVIILFKLFLAPSNDLLLAQGSLFDKILDASRYAIIFQKAGVMLWNLGNTPVSLIGLIILMAFLAGRSPTRVPGVWVVGAVIVMQLTVYFIIFLLTPNELTWHLNTSLDRLYLHVFPLAFLLFFIWIKSPQELTAKES
ncbi:MAG: hypothetical protein C4557_05065 [Anaerolineaceae bacterium]|jgi:hypothetical protein|nr:MAG: hypothetical protein C4557_05065 [Anaerolineaceae bacterium]